VIPNPNWDDALDRLLVKVGHGSKCSSSRPGSTRTRHHSDSIQYT
jgi:hypothetical protein